MSALGFFGGSFDPPHLGHAAVARWALAEGGLDRVVVAPVLTHPLGKEPAASFEHRLAMCALAFEALPSVEVSPIERELGGVSRTLRTLEALATSYPDETLRLLVGADVLAEAHRWHRWSDIVALARPMVVGRPGYTREGADAPPLVDASSTALRAALENGEDAAPLLDPRVLAYIEKHGLYGSAP